METKIEFFRFVNSDENYAELLKEYRNKNDIDSKESRLNKMRSELNIVKPHNEIVSLEDRNKLRKFFTDLLNLINEADNMDYLYHEVLSIFRNSTENYRFHNGLGYSQKRFTTSYIVGRIFNIDLPNEIMKKVEGRLLEDSTIQEINELKDKVELSNYVIFLEESIPLLAQEIELSLSKAGIIHDRISHTEIKSLNDKVYEMNKAGWQVKQIEGIQSGKYEKYSNHHSGYGYGYSYTEGILIVWEKL